jgi:cold shock CspA family protein
LYQIAVPKGVFVIKIMVFIDGTWMYSNAPRLGEARGRTDYHVDFGKLPRVLANALAKQLGGAEIDVVRTHLFGSFAHNYDLRDDDAVQRRLDFFSLLKEEYHYEVETFPINFRGRRLRRADRDPRDPFEPKEKCVDIALATSMLFQAALPQAYDIAITVLGDLDFKPVLQAVRRLGKRVGIASIRGSCAPDLADARDPDRVKDFDVIWLDDVTEELELRYEEHQRECESPDHVGDRRVWTTFRPRKGQRFYCDMCRAEFSRQKQEAQREYVTTEVEDRADPYAHANGQGRAGEDGHDDAHDHDSGHGAGPVLYGEVKKKVADRGFGFIHAEDGNDYFFHLTDLEGGLDFLDVHEGLGVDFEVKRRPSPTKAGAAQRVRRVVIDA